MALLFLATSLLVRATALSLLPLAVLSPFFSFVPSLISFYLGLSASGAFYAVLESTNNEAFNFTLSLSDPARINTSVAQTGKVVTGSSATYLYDAAPAGSYYKVDHACSILGYD